MKYAIAILILLLLALSGIFALSYYQEYCTPERDLSYGRMVEHTELSLDARIPSGEPIITTRYIYTNNLAQVSKLFLVRFVSTDEYGVASSLSFEIYAGEDVFSTLQPNAVYTIPKKGKIRFVRYLEEHEVKPE